MMNEVNARAAVAPDPRSRRRGRGQRRQVLALISAGGHDFSPATGLLLGLPPGARRGPWSGRPTAGGAASLACDLVPGVAVRVRCGADADELGWTVTVRTDGHELIDVCVSSCGRAVDAGPVRSRLPHPEGL